MIPKLKKIDGKMYRALKLGEKIKNGDLRPNGNGDFYSNGEEVVTIIKWAPLYEKWELPHSGPTNYRHESDFVDDELLFSNKKDAERYSRNNIGNYPYCTTGTVVKVKVTVEIIK